MRIKTPDFTAKKDIQAYIRANKSRLISQKCSSPVNSDVCSFAVSLPIKKSAVKSTDGTEGALRVKVVANTANWMDSHSDVILPGAVNESIEARKGMIPHIHDHIHRVDAKVGEVADIYTEDVSLSDLGLNMQGETEALIFETDIIKSYNESVYNQYAENSIKQHSIGLWYDELDFASDDEDYEEEYKLWQAYLDQIINKEDAERQGYFWIVKKYTLIENSAVLFGANSLTPTLSTAGKSTGKVKNSNLKYLTI